MNDICRTVQFTLLLSAHVNVNFAGTSKPHVSELLHSLHKNTS